MTREYSIFAWNVNIYNNRIHTWLLAYMAAHTPDIVVLSETKATEPILDTYLDQYPGYNYIVNAHSPANFHGVAMLVKADIAAVTRPVILNIPPRRDTKSDDPANGRVICCEIDNKFLVVGTYVPNSGVIPDPIKFDYRINIWDPAFSTYLNTCAASLPTLLVGDINVAQTDLDVSNPKTMIRYAGSRPAERASFSQFLQTGWVDVWRRDHPQEKGYTWISYNVRAGHGMRLDNIVASNSLAARVSSTVIGPFITVSDHIPISCKVRI